MAMWIIWIPYVDADNFITSHCNDLWAEPHHTNTTLSPVKKKKNTSFMVWISSVCLQSQRSWKITQSDQRIWMNHSVVCGPLAPGRVTAWLDFPHSAAIPCNVTDTSLKQHCHSLLSGSIFSYWHFPVSKEQGAYQKHQTGEGRIQSARKTMLHWQKYKADSLCRESNVTWFWFRWQCIWNS